MKDRLLPPIPIPWPVRLQDLQVRVLPWLVFAIAGAAVALLWGRHAAGPAILGQVEGQYAAVASTKPGLLTQMRAEPFAKVQAGDPLAEVMIVDPRMLESSLAVIRAELEMAKASLLPLTGHTRKWVEFERLKLEALQQRAALAAAQVKLRYAEAQFVRMDQLFQSGGTNVTNVVSQQMYEIAARDRDTLRAEIASQTNMITGLERSLAGFEAAELHAEASSDEPELRAALRLQEERLKQAEAEMRPLTLRAPISGMVSLVYRRAGENIPAGEPLALIVGPADRIIGYVTQPTRFEPRVGMKVRVSSRAPGRPGGFGTIREVGADVQRMPTNLLLSLSVSGRAVELGIPVLVSLPTGLSLRPGEVVDLQCERGPVAMP